jgi:hypothetical protein
VCPISLSTYLQKLPPISAVPPSDLPRDQAQPACSADWYTPQQPAETQVECHLIMSYSLDYDDPDSIRALLSRCKFHRSGLETSTSNDVEIEKQRALQELRRRHDEEMESLFEYLEVELTNVWKMHNQKIAHLQDQFVQSEIKLAAANKTCDDLNNEVVLLHKKLDEAHLDNELLRERLDNYHAGSRKAQDELRQFEKKASYEIYTANSELRSTIQRTNELESEVNFLRIKLREQQEDMVNKRRQYFTELGYKNSEIASLKNELMSGRPTRDLSISNTKVEVKDISKKIVENQDEELRKIKSESLASVKKLYTQDYSVSSSVNVNSNKKWDVESELTHENSFRKRNKVWIANHRPLSTRSNKPLASPLHLLGEEISFSYSDSNDEDEENKRSPQIEISRETLKKDADNSLSKRLEKMYCK